MEKFVDFMLLYVVYPWTYADNYYFDKIFLPLITILFFVFLYLFVVTKSRTQNQIVIFLLSFLCGLSMWTAFYGYLALPLSVQALRTGRTEFRSFLKVAYLRHSYGYDTPWYRSNEIDEKMNLDDISLEIEYEKDKLGDFYVSDKVFILGYLTALVVLGIVIFKQEGYQFFPNGYSEIALY